MNDAAPPADLGNGGSARKIVTGVVGIMVGFAIGLGALLFAGKFETSATNPAGTQEWRWAQADHEHIALAVAACSDELFDLTATSNHILHQLRLYRTPDGRFLPPAERQTRTAVASLETVVSDPARKFPLSNFQRTAIFLSDTIARARFETAWNSSINYERMYHFQLFIVAIGAITTILISIKSISNAGQNPAYAKWFFWIGIAAIIFSSVGTAASALNSFHNPREQYLKNEASLAALRQLHQDVASGVTSILGTTKVTNCGEFDPINKKEIGEQIDEWVAKLDKIVNGTLSGSATATANSATTTSSH